MNLFAFLLLALLGTSSHGTFTHRPSSATLLPSSTLRLNCSSDLSVWVQWRFTNETTGSTDFVFNSGFITPPFQLLYGIDGSSEYDLLAKQNTAVWYCGDYRCIENNGAGDTATASVAVASSPSCTVNPSSTESEDAVTYSCWVSSLCGPINVSMSLLNSGVTVATKTNSVTWTTSAADVANTAPTCSADYGYYGKVSASCPVIEILFAPRNLKITPSQSTYHPGERIQCSAEGNPAPSYHWTDLINGTVIQGAIFVIPEDMRSSAFAFQCTAYNFYKGFNHTATDNIAFCVPIAVTTLSTTAWITLSEITISGTGQPLSGCSSYQSATIALSVIAAVSIAFNVLQTIYILRRRTTTKPRNRGQHDTGTASDYSTLNISSVNTPVAYDSLPAKLENQTTTAETSASGADNNYSALNASTLNTAAVYDSLHQQ